MKEQYITLNQKSLKSALGVVMTRDQTYDLAAEIISILMQHIIGGLLCVPAVFQIPMFSPSAAAALARHGALLEVGWELQDTFVRMYRVLFGGMDGRAANPRALLIFMALHHSMGLMLVMPMNILYGELHAYHELVFLLQSAAAVGLLSQQWGYTLDMSSSMGLWKAKCLFMLTWVVMVYGRLLRYAFVCMRIIFHISVNGQPVLFGFAVVVTVMMSLVNMVFIGDITEKVCKFVPMSIVVQPNTQKKLLRKSSSFRHIRPLDSLCLRRANSFKHVTHSPFA
eukprot:CAMPEP_0113944458 /NCGR_PEP_ID=MMETSP1339-20121228/34436_1 /TAXON_ID=94617 /ORGANISM="Fibrocapsa japonica" /LENGTH=281 /DNA_ID=CAMNT_0000949671 /DNA_START=237 /DNA_END=1082 /DNA_ORIENTATION=+ /assembly_acc=CAM_ASM_000762